MTSHPETLATIRAMEGRCQQLLAQRDSWTATAAEHAKAADRLSREVDALRAENKQLREALTFYANPKIYEPHPHGPAFDRRDVSFRARAALEQPEARDV